MSVSAEAYRDLADACQERAKERDKYWGDLLVQYAEDHERRIKVARMLGMHGEYGVPPTWGTLLIRLSECLTTYRRSP